MRLQKVIFLPLFELIKILLLLKICIFYKYMGDENENMHKIIWFFSFCIIFYVYYNHCSVPFSLISIIFFNYRENKNPKTNGHYKCVFVSCLYPITKGTI